jgi:hypothetical protein
MAEFRTIFALLVLLEYIKIEENGGAPHHLLDHQTDFCNKQDV